jgi:hypothetical protein
MESLTKLIIPIYQQISKRYTNLLERKKATKQYILNEITRWSINKTQNINNYFFRPDGFKGTQDSKPFDVRLMYDVNADSYELKFGNLNASSASKMFQWDDKDPYKLQKALFLADVINKEIIPLMINGDVTKIQFSPHDEDDLANDRLSYFRNMFDKLGKDKFNWKYNKEEDKYFITKK